MKTDVIAGVSQHPAGRIGLLGRICGVVACELVADCDEIVVGSDITCDLVVPDPLIPSKAFRLLRRKCHAGTDQECRCYWILDVFRNARVYVNRRLTRHEKLAYGDVLSIGCHDLEFRRESDMPRNSRSNRNVSDICMKLMHSYPMPPGFLQNTPTYKYLARRRIATRTVGLLLAVLLFCVWLTPRQEYFAPVQAAIEIDIVDSILPAEAVRSMDDTVRQNFDTAEPTLEKADLVDAKPRIDELAPQPIITDRPAAPAAPPTLSGAIMEAGAMDPVPLIAELPDEMEVTRDSVKLAAATPAARQTIAGTADSEEMPVLAKRSDDTPEVEVSMITASEQDPILPPQDVRLASAAPAWKLPAMKPTSTHAGGPVISMEVAKLAAAAPFRRLSVEEAAQRAAEKSKLSGYRVRMDQGLTGKVRAETVDQNLTAGLTRPATNSVTVDRAAYMTQLAGYRASPVQFEEFRGMQVPVARISEQLAQLEINEQQNGTALTVDGAVTAQEMDVCWKSGGFKMHTAGDPPPPADPATYCYVGKSEVDGKPCIYISFVCVDPDVSKIKMSGAHGVAASLIKDDSVEVFLDTNNDRKDYYQLVVNTKGNFWGGYWPTPMSDGGTARDWDCAPVIKSTVNKDAGQWTCEIMVPFDKVGGVPPKGTRWAVNFCRNFRGQEEDWQLQSWFAVYDKNRNFHHPNLFGIFQW